MPPRQAISTISSCEEVADGIFLLKFQSRSLADNAEPGQFINVRIQDGDGLLLRRPFSISRVDGEIVEILFNVIGKGTRILTTRKPGDDLDIIGPLGKPFNYHGKYETAILIGGGLGVAPLPFLTRKLRESGKKVVTFLGARSALQLFADNLQDVHISTDDGSKGYRGTVVDLIKEFFRVNKMDDSRIFGCGPNQMLKALGDVAENLSIECELSLEGDMACGIGLCQGCPVERRQGNKKYALVCTEGPTFNSKEIVIESL